MRYLGVDLGKRRIGLALSDASAVLARPWQTVGAAPTPEASAQLVDRIVTEHLESIGEGDLAGVVVGLPRRLNGDDTDQTAAARKFAHALEAPGRPPVHLQDERLTSREAEAQLAIHERDWRKRKKQIDAAAAAILLQDFLDGRAPSSTGS
jgi:putative Holliday junction resolvase